MIYICSSGSRAELPGTPLLRLFEMTLSSQLLPHGYQPGVLSIDNGACIWLPAAKLAITTVGSDSPIEGFTHAQTADLSNIDLLAISLAHDGDFVECQLELFASHRPQKSSHPRIALWLSPHGIPSLVPVKPRGRDEHLPPSYALMPSGVSIFPDPFRQDDEWQDGVARAKEATRMATANTTRGVVLKLVR